ncbi:MAG: nucleoside-triphosphatase, partial [Bacteroidales bacterium]|nr:nucleoside-triphosphatase [Bacteroidales bacterium]
PLSVAIIIVWIIRYKRAMRQLVRPKFLISFILITVLAAIAITYLNGSKNALKEGLMIGVEMNVRAAIVILGFSVLGTELYNPKIRNYIGKSSFRNISAASELAFESLPFIIAHLPDARTYFVKPAEVIKTLLFAAEKRLNELKYQMRGHVFIVTGGIAEGKTSFLINLANELKGNGFSLGGFFAPRTLEHNKTIGYRLISVETGEESGFLKLKESAVNEGIGRFEIENAGLTFGEKLLTPQAIKNKQLIIIDEIGKLELNDGGWKDSFEKLVRISDQYILISVRNDFVDSVVEKFALQDCSYFPVSKTSINEVVEVISSKINHYKKN